MAANDKSSVRQTKRAGHKCKILETNVIRQTTVIFVLNRKCNNGNRNRFYNHNSFSPTQKCRAGALPTAYLKCQLQSLN